jgi:hypothetical protein
MYFPASATHFTVSCGVTTLARQRIFGPFSECGLQRASVYLALQKI